MHGDEACTQTPSPSVVRLLKKQVTLSALVWSLSTPQDPAKYANELLGTGEFGDRPEG